jgi:nucleoside-diphosphate-sugar epimerase
MDAQVDAVIHLAGLYDFQESYGNCYTNNVLPTQHIVEKLKMINLIRRVPLYMASTYAVNSHQKGAQHSEATLQSLPSKRIPYSFTKAVAEKIVTDSGIPSAVFRLGILVGRSTDGAVEKADGAYTFLNGLAAIAGSRLFKSLPNALRVLPFPANPDGLLPLVPVDKAAEIFHRALFMDEAASSAGSPHTKIYGVYNDESVRIREFCDRIIAALAPRSRGVYVKKIPPRLMQMAPRLLNITSDALNFSLNPVALNNPLFRETFGASAIPAFDEYHSHFFQGFLKYRGGSL